MVYLTARDGVLTKRGCNRLWHACCKEKNNKPFWADVLCCKDVCAIAMTNAPLCVTSSTKSRQSSASGHHPLVNPDIEFPNGWRAGTGTVANKHIKNVYARCAARSVGALQVQRAPSGPLTWFIRPTLSVRGNKSSEHAPRSSAQNAMESARSFAHNVSGGVHPQHPSSMGAHARLACRWQG